MRADLTRICRRDQRSMNTPANGPISEYGRYRTAKAAAAAPGLGNVVLLNKTYAPTPAVNAPSPAWEISRVANRRRKLRSCRTLRSSARNDGPAARPRSFRLNAASTVTHLAYGGPAVQPARPVLISEGQRARGPAAPSALDLATDELLHQIAGDVVTVLLGGRLHEVGGGRQDGPADAAILGDLRGPDGVDDHASGVRGVPDLQLVLQTERHVSECAPLEPDIGPLPVVQPGHVVRRADVHGCPVHFVRDLGGDRLRLGDLLRHQPLALQHVHEVHVAAEVELVCAEQFNAAVLEQLGQHAVRDSGAHLRLDVVTDDRHARVGELLGPHRVGGDEHGQRVDECDARVDGALRVVPVSLLGTDRQVRHQHVGAGVAENLGDIHHRIVGLGDHLLVVLAQAVHGRAALHGDAGRRHVADLDGVVLARPDGVGEILPDLLRVHVERGDELDVAHVVRTELDMHQAWYPSLRVGVLVVLHTLYKGAGAVARAHDGYPNRTHGDAPYLAPRWWRQDVSVSWRGLLTGRYLNAVLLKAVLNFPDARPGPALAQCRSLARCPPPVLKRSAH